MSQRCGAACALRTCSVRLACAYGLPGQFRTRPTPRTSAAGALTTVRE